LPVIFARLPDFSANISPHDLQLIFVVVCEKIIAFSPHFPHWTDRNELLGFGIIILSRFMSYLQFADPKALLHSFVLAGFTCITQSHFFGCLGGPLKLREFLAAVAFLVLGVPASAFCHYPVLALLI